MRERRNRRHTGAKDKNGNMIVDMFLGTVKSTDEGFVKYFHAKPRQTELPQRREVCAAADLLRRGSARKPISSSPPSERPRPWSR
jgi:hypothetical protein